MKTMYVIKSEDDMYYGTYGFVSNIYAAKLYRTEGTAKSVITFQNNPYDHRFRGKFENCTIIPVKVTIEEN